MKKGTMFMMNIAPFFKAAKFSKWTLKSISVHWIALNKPGFVSILPHSPTLHVTHFHTSPKDAPYPQTKANFSSFTKTHKTKSLIP